MKKIIPIMFSVIFIFFVTYKDVGLLNDAPEYKMVRFNHTFVADNGVVILSDTPLTVENLMKVGVPDCDFSYTAIPISNIIKIQFKPGNELPVK